MKVYKFRGKRKDNNEWIYGDLLQPKTINNITEISDCNSIDGSRYEVDPKTISQFIGSYDQEGKEVYEGDIVTFISKTDRNIEAKGYINYRSILSAFRIECYCGSYAIDANIEKIKIIGNIYEPIIEED